MARIFLITLLTACLGIAAFAVWFPFDVMLLGGYALLAFAGSGIGLGYYLISGAAKKDQQQALISREVEREQALYAEVEALSEQLKAMALPDSAKQAERLMGMLEDYRRVIEQKLGDTTITMSSYSAETGRVFRLSINNLKDILAAAQSVHTTKLETPDSDLLESEALQRRQALLTQQEARIESLVEQNRDLLTALNETTVQVANIKDINSFELQESLDRLRDLGERAQAFSKQ
ncbi:hypothetical protein [Reinekea blandensis]|uniref:Uncharacterized protein n=1 Tax=Reinekea blandensis MED297 TaxID=314283 RepID=A4BKH4_9GAMM|nr:hypothetical protein [Reinekea blandensis]EAR07373.1 hypothetical protein MED297_05454 [Reinekea sp. MED297] [Reinekea blandensis MED297]